MTGDEVIADIQRRVEQNGVGIELWLDSEEWQREKAEGVRFADWLAEVAKRA